MGTSVTIIDYDMGNLRSIANAMKVVGSDVRLVRHADEVTDAERLILPGVGAFGASMDNLRREGLDDAIRDHVSAGRPFLGICLGFQVLFDRGTELGQHEGLGLFRGSIDRFETDLHVPHVGWNALQPVHGHALWEGLEPGAHVYFVHSYRPTGEEERVRIGTSEYDGSFTCAVADGCAAGVQFHPEKSGADGLRILQNFLSWEP